MSQHLNNDSVTPPGGWQFRVPQTGKTFSGATYDALRVELGKHVRAHSLPMPSRDEIEDYICRQLGSAAKEYCTDDQTNMPVHNPDSCYLTFKQVLTGTRVLAAWVIQGRQRVDGVEAENRARICANCDQNRVIHGCKGCSMPALREAINSVVAGGRTTVDEQLNACCQCGCSLKAKVWLPLDLIHAHQSEDVNARLPAHCWMKTS